MRDSPNRILEFLTAKAKPAGDACRSNPRRRSSIRIELAWAEEKEWRTIPARLRDISRGGAALFARSAPPLTRKARLRIVKEDGCPWIEAEILGVVQETPTRYRIRVQFEAPCPNLLLRLAILDGLESAEQAGVAQEWVVWNSEVSK